MTVEERKIYRRQQYLNHKEKETAQIKAWYVANRDRKRASQKVWRTQNPKRERASQLKRRYNLTTTEYDNMLANQKGNCKLCGRPMRKPIVEHSHKEKRVRGLTCQRCNILIGSFEVARAVLPKGALEAYLGIQQETP